MLSTDYYFNVRINLKSFKLILFYNTFALREKAYQF